MQKLAAEQVTRDIFSWKPQGLHASAHKERKLSLCHLLHVGWESLPGGRADPSWVCVSLWYGSAATGVRGDESLCEGVRLKRAIARRAVPRHSLVPVPAPPSPLLWIKQTGCIPCPVAQHRHLIRTGRMSWGGQEGTVILWKAKCLASSACEFGVSEQEEQNKAEAVQGKSFLNAGFRKSYDLCISTQDSL